MESSLGKIIAAIESNPYEKDVDYMREVVATLRGAVHMGLTLSEEEWQQLQDYIHKHLNEDFGRSAAEVLTIEQGLEKVKDGKRIWDEVIIPRLVRRE